MEVQEIRNKILNCLDNLYELELSEKKIIDKTLPTEVYLSIFIAIVNEYHVLQNSLFYRFKNVNKEVDIFKEVTNLIAILMTEEYDGLPFVGCYYRGKRVGLDFTNRLDVDRFCKLKLKVLDILSDITMNKSPSVLDKLCEK